MMEMYKLKKITGNTAYDIIVSYTEAKRMVEHEGFSGWLDYLKKLYPEKCLYVISTSWFENRKFICKAKGSYGDLLIGWREEVFVNHT